MKSPLLGASLLIALSACVRVDGELGKELIDKSLLYDTYTAEFDLEEVQLKRADDLSGYSDTRITIGAIRDEVFGLTTRSCAFTLVPASDTLDFGLNPVAVKFDIHFAADTVSVADPSQEHILQGVHVYELTAPLSTTHTGTNQDLPHGTERITKGVPVLNGIDSLSFEFTTAFAQKYIDGIRKVAKDGRILIQRTEDVRDTVSMEDYTAVLPGIYIETDRPEGNGGRINMFDLSCLSVSNSYYTQNGNLAILTFRTQYTPGKDTLVNMLFIPGEPAFYDEYSYVSNNTKFYQYAFNRTSHETVDQAATDRILVEGGGGLKPVILASELQRKTLEAIREKGGEPDRAVINKATLLLPFEMPADYKALDYFPSVLSPTIRTEDEDAGTVSFGGLTDASASSENQGDLDRSNLTYAPDITYHLQEILLKEDLADRTDRDVWLLTVHTETTENATGSVYDNEYYQALMYQMYASSLYGGSYYGGYSSYGGYGYNSYSNYYNYLMLAQMMAASSQSSTSTTQELDKDRYYCAILGGPTSGGRKPRFRVTFSLPQG